ncbi:patatin-like phospholipase family protein [Aureibaculum sp. 2210JD6-5]|uniref:patatin-like phospholipase family protein n=1 Tax=Aureibaculum sp. 2210JD6-5 TaxID=3103957 RepID=UPI002AADFAA3|nr:patatin-like phospholipase family protein [Aureibaculum sp. 2210JD6-5]MDY7395995.1 patatin-like phospholipase family protein [Aureibaculum sp. 2210JD6-5]
MLKKILIVLLLSQTPYMFGQDSIKPQKDLKVGLVLSGGGAKGFAHVGALKILEEAGVRIDYIGGTSMGAIIGALYSSGYSASELDSIITSLDLNELMQDNLPRKSKSIYQKENTEKYALTLPIKNRGVQLPTALSKGQNVFNILTQLTDHVHNITDFSKLPIPFFCIATNLEDGSTEILEDGFLPQALRASGSFPTLLDPVEVNGKLLTDGGVVNNFPVDIMREKDVDIIIGIDVQDKLKGQKGLNSALEIVMQIVSFQMYSDGERKRNQADVYIHPDITDFNVISFDATKDIIESGKRAAKKQLSAFQQIAKKQNIKDYNFNKKNILKNEYITFDEIKISGNKNYTDEYVIGKLNFKEKDSISYRGITDGINNLSATGNFRNIQYQFVPNNESTNLQLKLREEELSTFLQFGVHYDDLYKTGVLINLTSKHAIFKNDVLSADLILGDNIRYNIDYFIDNGFHWSYGIKTRYNKFKKSFFENIINDDAAGVNVGKVPINYNDYTTQLFVQNAFTKGIAIRLGAENKYIRTYFETIEGNNQIKNFVDKTSYVSAYTNLLLDTYDNKNFPKKGIYFFADYHAYLLASNFDESFKPFSQLKGELAGAFTIGNKFTTQIVSQAGITIGDGTRIFNYFLGGANKNFINNFYNFYGYDVADLGESAFLKTAVTLRYELFKKNHISFIANAARAEKDIFNEGAIFDNTKIGFAAGYSVESFLGPLEIKYAWSPDTQRNYWLFNVGFWF